MAKKQHWRLTSALHIQVHKHIQGKREGERGGHHPAAGLLLLL